MTDPLFSIIIPTYNSQEKLAATLDSVLVETEIPYEIVIRDGASTDETLKIIRVYEERYPERIRWASENDAGVYDAMNKGIDNARGRYLYFLGAGDRVRPSALKRIGEAIPAQEVALIYGNVWWVDKGIVYDGPFRKERLLYCNPSHQAIFYDRRIFERLGRFDLRYNVAADWAFNMKCFGDVNIQKVYIDTIIADFEGGGVSATQGDDHFGADHIRLARESLGLPEKALRYLETEQGLGKRSRSASSAAARAFWRAQWIFLRRVVRPVRHRRLRGSA
ncbi:MAG TPA: glycosyltransferase family 2 protein [Capsulimonadaceae bacterium]|nr:glycosyltransferase family 2 protein [Capsulimonadaceae bacterium]